MPKSAWTAENSAERKLKNSQKVNNTLDELDDDECAIVDADEFATTVKRRLPI